MIVCIFLQILFCEKEILSNTIKFLSKHIDFIHFILCSG